MGQMEECCTLLCCCLCCFYGCWSSGWHLLLSALERISRHHPPCLQWVLCLLADLGDWLPMQSSWQVTMLLRDPYLCKDINEQHCNTRYLKVG